MVLLASSAATAALAVYQWLELLDVRRGGTALCAVSEQVNCVSVWNSTVASALHRWTGVPVAGLGLVWALGALAVALWLWRLARRGDRPASLAATAAAVRLCAAVGLLAVLAFIGASFELGAVCLTCVGTYAFVTAYAVGAFALLPGPRWPGGDALLPAAARAFICAAVPFLLVLYPGLETPQAPSSGLPMVTAGAPGADPGSSGAGGATRAELGAYFANLPPSDARFAARARSVWLAAPAQDVTAHPVRARHGPADAPVRIVDFTDVQCGHCRTFAHVAEQLLELAPKGSVSFESRHFPLDGECNRYVERRSPTALSCLAAKLLICLERSPQFGALRLEVFDRQAALSPDVLWTIALKSGATRTELEACVASPATRAALDDDIAYAMRFRPEGTPLVVLNGRKTEPSPTFLLGMILGGGDPNGPLLAGLPKLPPEALRGGGEHSHDHPH